MRSFPAHKSRGQEVPPEVQADFFFFSFFFEPSPWQKEKCVWGVAVNGAREGSGGFQGLGFIGMIVELLAGFCPAGSWEAESLDLGLGRES